MCCKEQSCWECQSLNSYLPLVPGPVATEFLLVIPTGTGQFFTSLLLKKRDDCAGWLMALVALFCRVGCSAALLCVCPILGGKIEY